MSDYETLRYEVSDGILTLWLHRPENLNAFTVAMANELEAAYDRASADDDVAAIVVTGSGRAFCAGMDLSAEGNVFGLDETLRPTMADMTDRFDDPEIIAGVRAEDIHAEARDGLVPLHASVVLAEALGSSVHVTFALEGTPVDESRLGGGLANEADGEIARLNHAADIQGTAIFPPRMLFRTDDAIQIHVDPPRMHFFDLESGLALR